MKEILNEPFAYVKERLGGIMFSVSAMLQADGTGRSRHCPGGRRDEGKGGHCDRRGSGHLPVFTGYVGKGLLDACAIGEFFSSPSVDQMAEAIRAAGKGELGDKTVLDVLDAVRMATAGIADPTRLVAAVDQAVADSLVRFRDQPARQGRARIFAERSVGRDDPGMVAFKRIVKAVKE